MDRLVRHDREETAKESRILALMDYNSRRPPQGAIRVSQKQESQATVLAVSKIGQYKSGKPLVQPCLMLHHSDARVRLWSKQHESIDPSCLLSMAQAAAGGVMIWGIAS